MALVAERPAANWKQVDPIRRQHKRRAIGEMPLDERIERCRRFVSLGREGVGSGNYAEMGRPIRYASSEIRGFEERADAMIEMAPRC